MKDPSAIDPVDWTLLLRYLSGEATPTERHHAEQWINANLARRAYVASLRELAETYARAADAYDPLAALRLLHVRLGLDGAEAATSTHAAAKHSPDLSFDHLEARSHIPPLPSATPPRQPHARPRGVGAGFADRKSLTRRGRLVATHVAIAATMVIALLIAVMPRSNTSRLPLALAPGRELATAAGQRVRLTLVDGTQVTLAPASRLSVATTYGTGERTVTLVGEAYFDVVHSAAHPLTVEARNAVARDLGTRFVVRSYPEDAGVRVAVAEGAVSLGDATRSPETRRVLRSGALGEIDGAGVMHVTGGVSMDDYVGWASGRIVFSDTPVSEVLAELSRWYDLSISATSDRLMSRRVTLTFTDAPADAVLDALAAATGTRVERHGRQVILVSASRANQP
jgi:transmembrane sensor